MRTENNTPVDTEDAVAQPSPQAKKWISCICGLLFLAACGLIVYFVPFLVFQSDWATQEMTLLETAKILFAKGNTAKLFGFLPALFVGDSVAEILSTLSPYFLGGFIALAALLFLFALFSGSRGLVKTGLVFMLLGVSIHIVLVFLVSNQKTEETFDTNAISLLAITIVLFILVCFITRKRMPKVEPVQEPEVDPVEEMMKTFHTEEVIEAYPYEGGPVAGIEIAEEVYPTAAALDAQRDPDGAAKNTVVSLLGNGFDAFLITLNEKEKNEFIDLYVLKCKGIMPEIPGYVVGGDNKDFFTKVFIYLGQYRDKIPGDLLAKMYNFSMKI